MNVPETVRAELREYLRELGAARSRLEKSKAKRDAKKKKKKQATPDPVNQNTNINMNEMNAQSYPIKNSDSPALVTTFKRPRPTSAESTNSTRFFAALTPKKKFSPHDEYQQLKEDIAYKVQRMNEIRKIADIQQGRLKANCSIYFLVIAIKTHFKTDTYLCKVAWTLISLMNERAEPTILSTAGDPSTSQSIKSLIESHDIRSEHMSASILHPRHRHF